MLKGIFIEACLTIFQQVFQFEGVSLTLIGPQLADLFIFPDSLLPQPLNLLPELLHLLNNTGSFAFRALIRAYFFGQLLRIVVVVHGMPKLCGVTFPSADLIIEYFGDTDRQL